MEHKLITLKNLETFKEALENKEVSICEVPFYSSKIDTNPDTNIVIENIPLSNRLSHFRIDLPNNIPSNISSVFYGFFIRGIKVPTVQIEKYEIEMSNNNYLDTIDWEYASSILLSNRTNWDCWLKWNETSSGVSTPDTLYMLQLTEGCELQWFNGIPQKKFNTTIALNSDAIFINDGGNGSEVLLYVPRTLDENGLYFVECADCSALCRAIWNSNDGYYDFEPLIYLYKESDVTYMQLSLGTNTGEYGFFKIVGTTDRLMHSYYVSIKQL